MIPLIILAFMIPFLMQKSIVQVSITSLSEMQYSEDIYTNGFIEEEGKKDIIAELPIVPDKVYFKIGDHVNTSDVIADVDINATRAAIFNIAEMSKLIPQEYMAVMGNINIDEEYVEKYIPRTIVSPASGTITSINLVEGAISTPQTAVVTINRFDSVRVRMTVNEVDADKVKVGDTVVFKANATSDVKYTGKVERLFPTASKTLVGTTQATVVGLYVKLDKDYQRLKPGYTVNGVIKQPSIGGIFTLPYEAVLQDKNNQEYVYIINGSRVNRCDVKTGKELSNSVEIISPNLINEKIVFNASQIKKPNQLVRIIKD